MKKSNLLEYFLLYKYQLISSIYVTNYHTHNMTKLYQDQSLRIDKYIIEKASRLKIDIPAITEELLKSNKYNKDYTRENVLAA